MTVFATTTLSARSSAAGLVSVIMPVLDEAPWISAALSGVLGQTYEDLELIVADGGSTDGTRSIIESIGSTDERVRLVENPRRLQSAGLNEALALARGDYLVRLDARSFIDEDYVQRCIEELSATGAAVVGGRMVPVPQTSWVARGIALANRRPWGAGPARFHHSDRSGPAETVYLGAFRRQIVEELGGWSEHAGVNEDYELNHRVRRAGHVVWFDTDLQVGYQPRSSVRGLTRQYLRYGRSKATVLRQHPSSVRLRQFLPALLVPAALLLIAPRFRKVSLAVMIGHGLAITGGAAAEQEEAHDRLAGAIAGWLMHWSWSAGFWWGAIRPFPSAQELVGGSEENPAAEAMEP